MPVVTRVPASAIGEVGLFFPREFSAHGVERDAGARHRSRLLCFGNESVLARRSGGLGFRFCRLRWRRWFGMAVLDEKDALVFVGDRRVANFLAAIRPQQTAGFDV